MPRRESAAVVPAAGFSPIPRVTACGGAACRVRHRPGDRGPDVYSRFVV